MIKLKIIFIFNYNNNIYFKDYEVADMLGYIDTKKAIDTHVKTNDKFIITLFFGGGDSPLSIHRSYNL